MTLPFLSYSPSIACQPVCLAGTPSLCVSSKSAVSVARERRFLPVFVVTWRSQVGCPDQSTGPWQRTAWSCSSPTGSVSHDGSLWRAHGPAGAALAGKSDRVRRGAGEGGGERPPQTDTVGMCVCVCVYVDRGILGKGWRLEGKWVEGMFRSYTLNLKASLPTQGKSGL